MVKYPTPDRSGRDDHAQQLGEVSPAKDQAGATDPNIEMTAYRTPDGRSFDAHIYSAMQETGVFTLTVADVPETGSQTQEGALMSDDWKWVLKESAATRPVLRMLPLDSTSDPQRRQSAVGIEGRYAPGSGRPPL